MLIDEPNGRLIFGLQPDEVDDLTPITTLSGAPFPGGHDHPEAMSVQIGDTARADIPTAFDSGGKGGWIPAASFPDGSQLQLGLGVAPAGTPISVYSPDGTLLSPYTTSGGPGPGTVIMPERLLSLLGFNNNNLMNTGNAAFAHTPSYISNADGGSMTFYGPATP